MKWGLGLLMVSLVVGLLAFFLGYQTAVLQRDDGGGESDNTIVEVITETETIEVTREVMVPVTVAAPEGSESVAVPTSTPEPVEEAGGEVLVPVDDVDMALLRDVWQLMDLYYDGDVPEAGALLEAAIQGSLETLDDPFTRYLPPAAAERRGEESFEGIGAMVNVNEDDEFVIVRPFDGQPADEAGVKAGDVVLAVDGELLAGKTLDESVRLVRGPRGTEVTLTVRRDGEELDIVVTRALIEIPVVTSRMLPDNIAYVQLTQFNGNAEAQLTEALAPLLAEEPIGVILDLRDNPGGLLTQALAVTDMFVVDGPLMYERNNNGLDRTFEGEAGGLVESLPLVVLINAGSASASEIVAGAVRDTERGILIGETTFGKGSVQQVNRLDNGGELLVTIARWYTPDNITIDGQGVAPNIFVETPEDLGGDSDTQLQRAINYLMTGD
ncbi:MAG TPA: S41 family peptidase [Anaerolineae bacterium]|nr:S41 family peptidase [Anaerolineae bacterium]